MRATPIAWLGRLLPASGGSQTTAEVDGWPTWWAFAGWFAAIFASSFGVVVAIGAGADSGGILALLAGQVGLWIAFVATAALSSRAFGSGNVVPDFGMLCRSGDALKATLIGVAVQVVAVPLIYLPVVVFGGDLDVSGPAEALFEDLSPLGSFAVAFGVVVFAPISEELLFRGVLQRGLASRLGDTQGIWVGATIFAISHFQPVQFPGLLAVGLVLGWLAARTGGIGASIWAHAGFNATTAFLLIR